MKTVYAVSSGTYSDYRVHAIFETKDEAEAAANDLNSASGYLGAEVEKMPFYEKGSELPKRFMVYWAEMGLDAAGPAIQPRVEHELTDRQADYRRPRMWRGGPGQTVRGRALTEEAARKVVVDEIYKWRAERENL